MSNEEYFQQIKKFLSDQQQIITYKWLSTKLEIHINTSKRLLLNFIQNHQDEENKITSTYLIGGILSENKGYAFEICNETDLENIKKKFEKITSEHVYSLQSLPKVEDFNTLRNIDYDLNNKKIINCKAAIIKENEEIIKRREAALAATATKDNGPSKTPKPPAKNLDNSESTKKPNKILNAFKTSEANTKIEEDKKNEDSQEKEKEKEKEIPSNKSNNKPAGKKKPPVKGLQGIQSFFNRQNKTEIKKKETPPKESEIINKESEKEKSPEPEKIVEKLPEKENSKNSTKKDSSKQTVKELSTKKDESKPKESRNTKTKNKNNQRSKETKTRKRIVQISDSENSSSEEDIFEKEDKMRMDLNQEEPKEEETTNKKLESDNEEIIPPTPEQKGRKRRKKVIDKTYAQDGYILTKKEVVFESCTDSEPEIENQPAKKKEKMDFSNEPAKKKEKKDSSNEKNKRKSNDSASGKTKKQTSLMNFFQSK